MSISDCWVAALGLVSESLDSLSAASAGRHTRHLLVARCARFKTDERRSGLHLLRVVLAVGFASSVSLGGVVSSATETNLEAALLGGGEVTFEVSGTIPITSTKVISANTTLNAAGREVTLSGTLSNRLFQVGSNVSLTIVGITLTRGSHAGDAGGEGTAGENGGHGQEGAGGAVYLASGGRLHALNAVFATNSAAGGAGGAGGSSGAGSLPGGQGGHAGSARGGAIFSNGGEVRLTNCVLVANRALGGDGGSGGDGGGGLNGGDGGGGGLGGSASGGAIYSTDGAILQLVNCTLSTNDAGGGIGGAGGLGNGGLGFDGANGTAGEAMGGSVFCSNGRVEFLNCTFDHSSANGAHGWDGKVAPRADPGEDGRGGARGGGGAIAFAGGSATFTNCTLYANAVKGGDGGDGGQGGTTGFGGEGGDGGDGGDASGGGIYNAGATSLLLVNCTFAANATAGGLGGEGGDPGTALAQPGGNGAAGLSQGGAIANSLGTVTLMNTLLADSPSGGNASGAFSDGGHNLSSDASPVFTAATSLGSTNAHLGTFAEHGGPPRTVALLPGSPAIDGGDVEVAPLTDQRGYARSGPPDIGAYESNDVLPSPSLAIERQHTNVMLSWPAGFSDYRLQSTRSLTLTNWVTVSNQGLVGEYWVATNQIIGTSQLYRLLK